MDCAINLDNESGCRAIEVGDVSTDPGLSSELKSQEPPILETLPKELFLGSGVISKHPPKLSMRMRIKDLLHIYSVPNIPVLVKSRHPLLFLRRGQGEERTKGEERIDVTRYALHDTRYL